MISVPKSISRRSSDWKSIKRKAFLDNLDLKRNYKMYSPKRYPPAGARDQSSLPCSCWDFPRIRGEKIDFPSSQFFTVGSPPHTRGKVHPRQIVPQDGGITPAYAGKSSRYAGAPRHDGITPAYAGKRPWRPSPSQSCRDHPRIRGEKACRCQHSPHSWGSPPHTRGKADRAEAARESIGITPAYAGKRHRMHGSSIRAGITPAYAGKSLPGPHRPWPAWDHPRIRGEKALSRRQRHQNLGSPPHMRGKGHR